MIALGIPFGRRTCQQSHASMIYHWTVFEPAVHLGQFHSSVDSIGILDSPENDLDDHQILVASRQNARAWNLVAEIDASKQQHELVDAVPVDWLGGEPAVGSVGSVPVAVEGSAEVVGSAVAVDAAAVVAAAVAAVAVLLGFAADLVVSVLVDVAVSGFAVEFDGQPQRPDRYQSVSVPEKSLVLETQVGSEVGSRLAVDLYAVAAAAAVVVVVVVVVAVAAAAAAAADAVAVAAVPTLAAGPGLGLGPGLGPVLAAAVVVVVGSAVAGPPAAVAGHFAGSVAVAAVPVDVAELPLLAAVAAGPDAAAVVVVVRVVVVVAV